MRDDAPSLTARGVVLARSLLDRPTTSTGDAEVETQLAALLGQGPQPADWVGRIADRSASQFLAFLGARTEFMDSAVVVAIGAGVRQVVILGAGYDCRAMRFRTPGVQFYEVDHPATQRDKRARLAEVGAGCDDVCFVSADFTQPGMEDRVVAAGFDRGLPALLLCEGLLRYLPEQSFRALLASAAALGAAGSELAASISTNAKVDREETERELAHREHLAETGEPVLTVPPSDLAVAWVRAAGWKDLEVRDIADSRPEAGRGRLLVHAHS
jgi:methyltransferase (TIGR00027 family)